MKIDPAVKTLAPAPIAEERTPMPKQSAEQPGNARGEVQLSSLSSSLRSIESNLGTTQSVDGQRVAKIKQAIAEKRFEVNSSVVADRLIDSTREFLRSQKQ
ncbi:MAG: flagellar biosynthesis anti-sigma factor FlgM [Pseudomonadota bacterium]